MTRKIEIIPIAERFNIQNETNIQIYPLHMKMNTLINEELQGEIVYIFTNGLENFVFGKFTKMLNTFNGPLLDEIKEQIRSEIRRETEHKHLIPCKEWYCDRCGEVVTVETGLIQCTFNENELSNIELMHENEFIHNEKVNGQKFSTTIESNNEGLTRLSFLLEKFSTNLKLIELIKRIHVPYYEEIRKHPNLLEKLKHEPIQDPFQKYNRKTLRELVLTIYNN